jgi:putative cell wall-binding protein
VHFTIDFGDETSTAQSEETDTALGSQESGTAEAMKPIARGRDDIDRAIAHHVYDEPGAYTITVTATPDEGASETVEVTVHVGQGSARVSGDSRVDTAIDVSRESFPERGSAGGVLLTRGDAYADALAAASLSGQRDAPILLTGESNLHQSVLDEINRVLADDGVVTVLGGEQAVAPAVVETLESAGLTAERISGPDRIATALGIAESVAGVERDEDEAPDAIVASAEGFADALSASSFAAQSEAPILLTGSDELDERVAAFLEELGGDAEVILAGGPAAISERVAEQLSGLVGSVERIGGSDRFATSARMADELFPDSDVAVVATGGDFADALAGGAAAGRLGAPIVLVGDVVPESVAAELSERVGETKSALVLGGDAAVPEDVRQEVGAALGLD